MTPAEVTEKALTLCGVDEPYDAATVILGALAEQGQVIVSAEDLKIVTRHCYLPIDDGRRAAAVLDARDRLRAALPRREVRIDHEEEVLGRGSLLNEPQVPQ